MTSLSLCASQKGFVRSGMQEAIRQISFCLYFGGSGNPPPPTPSMCKFIKLPALCWTARRAVMSGEEVMSDREENLPLVHCRGFYYDDLIMAKKKSTRIRPQTRWKKCS